MGAWFISLSYLFDILIDFSGVTLFEFFPHFLYLIFFMFSFSIVLFQNFHFFLVFSFECNVYFSFDYYLLINMENGGRKKIFHPNSDVIAITNGYLLGRYQSYYSKGSKNNCRSLNDLHKPKRSLC